MEQLVTSSVRPDNWLQSYVGLVIHGDKAVKKNKIKTFHTSQVVSTSSNAIEGWLFSSIGQQKSSNPQNRKVWDAIYFGWRSDDDEDAAYWFSSVISSIGVMRARKNTLACFHDIMSCTVRWSSSRTGGPCKTGLRRTAACQQGRRGGGQMVTDGLWVLGHIQMVCNTFNLGFWKT